MPKFDKPKKGDSVKVIAAGGYHPPEPIAKIVEPRCHVCQHPQRDQIDRLLAMKTSYAEISRLFSTEEKKLDERSVSKHEKKHLKYEDEAVRQIIEYEAGLAQENLEEGVKGAFMRRTILDVALRKAFDEISSGAMPIEAKDIPKMIEMREKLDNDTATAQIAEWEKQFLAFKEAIQEVCPPEMWQQILIRTKQILTVRPALESPQ